jgi:vancomycin resistance protein VanW
MSQLLAGVKKPLQRSRLRLVVGRTYFTIRRYVYWYLSHTRFARVREKERLPHVVFQHQSPLLRELRNIDMWLQRNKVENLRLAIGRLNGLILEPGEVFSYWRIIGRPSARRSYKVGMILFNGEIRHGIGGGLCQLSNLIYWMTLHSPLTVRERHRHSFDVFPDAVRVQPFGSGATCAYNYIDLQIENTTQDRYQLNLWLSETHLHGEWLCSEAAVRAYQIVERNHVIQSHWWGGYSRHNELYRREYDRGSGQLLEETFVTANDALMMYSPMLGDKNPAVTSRV